MKETLIFFLIMLTPAWIGLAAGLIRGLTGIDAPSYRSYEDQEIIEMLDEIEAQRRDDHYRGW